MAVPLGVVSAKATLSGPLSAAIRVICAAMVSSASSQLILTQPGSTSSLGRVRFIGYSSRSSLYTCSGAAWPLAHNARPVGCEGSASIRTNRPSFTIEKQPQRERHRAHHPGTLVSPVCACTALVIINQPRVTTVARNSLPGKQGLLVVGDPCRTTIQHDLTKLVKNRSSWRKYFIPQRCKGNRQYGLIAFRNTM